MALNSAVLSVIWSLNVTLVTFLVLRYSKHLKGMTAYLAGFLLRLTGLLTFGFIVSFYAAYAELTGENRETSLMRFLAVMIIFSVFDMIMIIRFLKREDKKNRKSNEKLQV